MKQIKDIDQIVQEEFEKKLNVYSNKLSKPYFNCLKDTIKGMISASTPIVRQISQYLPGKVSCKKKQERISYHLDNKESFKTLNDAHIMIESKKITSNSLIIIDESDIIKPCAKKMENLSKVRDGSTGEYNNGYYSFNSTIANIDSIGSVSLSPFYSYTYANNAEEETKNQRLENFINDVTVFSNNKGIYVFDRGYDDRKLIAQLMDQDNVFVIRSTGRRNLFIDGKETKFEDAMHDIKLKYTYQKTINNKKLIYGVKRVSICTDPHPLKNPNTVEVWLIKVRYGVKGGLFYFYANFKDNNMAKILVGENVLDIYSKRWKIEEVFRQVKQDLNWEKIQIIKYNRIQTMNLWLLILTSFIYSCKKFIIEFAKSYPNFLFDHKYDNVPLNGFVYYRITRIIKLIFSGYRRRNRKIRKVNINNDIQITIESYTLEFFGVC